MATTIRPARETEVTILARLFGGERGQLPHELARYLLDLGFSDQDKARMHDPVVRNRRDALSPVERDEMLAYGKAGDLLAILKSQARRTLGRKLDTRDVS